MGLIETEAITLRTHKLEEADKVAIFLTPGRGAVRGVARGARRLKSRFGASLEPCTHVFLVAHEREGRELLSIKQTEILRSYFDLTGEPKAHLALAHMCDLTVRLAPPHDPQPKFFRMFKAALEACADSPALSGSVARYFELWALRLMGFMSDARRCALCRARLEGGAAFYGAENGLRCAGCAGQFDAEASSEALNLLRELQSLAPKAWAERFSREAAATQSEVSDFARMALARTLERRIETLSDSFPVGEAREEASETTARGGA